MSLLFQTKKIVKKLLFNEYEIWAIGLIRNNLEFKMKSLFLGININKNFKPNIHNFRRNIHRVEKGLIYKDLKKVFAEDYIYQTVELLKLNKDKCYIDDVTLSWGEAVLDKYFKICTHTDEIKKSFNVYCHVRTNGYKHPDWVPYEEFKRPELSVDYENFLNLSVRRRSVRFFQEKTVEKKDIEKAMEIAKYSPSACNRQAYKFLFYNDKEVVEKISAIPGGIVGYDLPSIIIVVGCYSGYFDERDINAPVIDSSLAAMTFIYSLETLGLSSVCINWPCIRNKEIQIREIIDLNADEFIVMLIGVGWADKNGKIPFSSKKPVNDLLEFNTRVKI